MDFSFLRLSRTYNRPTRGFFAALLMYCFSCCVCDGGEILHVYFMREVVAMTTTPHTGITRFLFSFDKDNVCIFQ